MLPKLDSTAGFAPLCTVGHYRNCRWIEKPASCGLRFVGFADEIVKRAVRHYDEAADEIARMRRERRTVVSDFRKAERPDSLRDLVLSKVEGLTESLESAIATRDNLKSTYGAHQGWINHA